MFVRFFRFGIVGAATVATHAVAFLALAQAGVPAGLSNGMAYVLSIAVSYAGQSRWTFADRPNRSIPMYVAAVLANLALGGAAAWLIVDYWGLSPYWQLPIILIVLPITSYLMLGHMVFTRSPESK